jgi:hypothetical protein
MQAYAICHILDSNNNNIYCNISKYNKGLN